MRPRVVIAVISLMMVVVIPQSLQAHGSITTNAASVLVGGCCVRGSYTYNTSQQHTTVFVAVTLQRRPGGGGTWVTLDTESQSIPNASGGTVFTSFVAHNCAYDYKAFGSGNVFGSSAGVHLQASDTAPIFQNTC
jgi:type II secretory pathway pseudopilin PulG